MSGFSTKAFRQLLLARYPPERDGTDEPRVSFRELSRAIRDECDVSISSTYLNDLYRGTKANPSAAHLVALARFFGVSVDSLTDYAATREATRQRRGVEQLAEVFRGFPEVEAVLLRGGPLTSAQQEAVMRVLYEQVAQVLDSEGTGDEGGRQTWGDE
ncbi:hypothetical protein SAMN05421810_10942 [Amycolatopsis arida]|uniref:HTH cro/C1-type domain-containing protein n=1 Tax=Amycolatopsis arida TaxID=587909 RepID=A0A1I5ZCI3_9PSEU|nr:helix-turn-helix transcriptional regulator [Amycolatopsis arida]TDX89521.1 hypothetical protein CLV69_10941 [Amycolatopsis arida]SFQ54164.1 hypothetical protein SAMN05421810_10942 [Amycolatopsis arida]